ncbi:MAG: hypothetical protein HXY22_02230 [Alphaproteobacteria bacterium]|nr:hypothetical protein [Alphaproteobacteria bacterium]
MKVLRVLLPAAVAAGLVVLSDAPVDATVFPAHGGSGDSAEELRCPAGQLLVGLKGRTGYWIDQVSLICAPFDPQTYARGAFVEVGPRGGNGGSPAEQYCQGDSAVRQINYDMLTAGFNGPGKFARRIEFACSRPRDGGSEGSAVFAGNLAYSATVGMTVTNELVVSRPEIQHCPGNEYAVGLNLRFGKHVNAVGLICDQVVSAPPASATGMPREAVVAGMQDNIDRPGSDFDRFQINDQRPDRCQSECNLKSDRCKAWTYVRPGIQGQYAVCYLKNAVPQARADACCISGTVERWTPASDLTTTMSPGSLFDQKIGAPVAQGPASMSVACTNPNGQQCDNYAEVPGQLVPGQIRVSAPTTHCSKVIYTVAFMKHGDDGLHALRQISAFTTRPLGPGESDEAAIDARASQARIYAYGVQGGCNQGYIDSWGVTVQIIPQ